VMVFIFAGNRGHGEEEAKDALLTFFWSHVFLSSYRTLLESSGLQLCHEVTSCRTFLWLAGLPVLTGVTENRLTPLLGSDIILTYLVHLPSWRMSEKRAAHTLLNRSFFLAVRTVQKATPSCHQMNARTELCFQILGSR
jgi:hypothetical protein